MNIKILSKDKDPMGAAILDYQKSERVGRLRVLSSMFEEDEMPVKHLFRKVEEMPMLEQKALRGVMDAECINLFDEHLETGFDTILLLMNGTGIAGKIENLPALFNRLKALLNKGGQILIDSSDIKYIYENEDGSFDINLNAAYYGEVDYQMVYKDVKGDSFDWLYVDFPLLKSIAESCGLHGELIAEGEHYDYLARFF